MTNELAALKDPEKNDSGQKMRFNIRQGRAERAFVWVLNESSLGFSTLTPFFRVHFGISVPFAWMRIFCIKMEKSGDDNKSW